MPELLQPPVSKLRSHVFSIDSFLSLSALATLPRPQWLARHLFPERGLIVVHGKPKHGKSFVVLDALLRIAYGLECWGRSVNGGTVIYVAGEGVSGVRVRVDGWRKYHALAGQNAPFWLVDRAVNLLDKDQVRAFIAYAKQAVAQGGSPLRVVCFDTLARCSAGGEENSAQTMSTIVGACDRIRTALGCAVVLVHHEGRTAEGRPRGHNSLDGAVDTMIGVQKTDEGAIAVSLNMQKDGPDGEVFNFALDLVALDAGPYQDEPTTTCVVSFLGTSESQDEAAAPANDNQLSGNAKILYEALCAADAMGLDQDDWKARALANGLNANRPASFREARDALIRKGFVEERDGLYYPVL